MNRIQFTIEYDPLITQNIGGCRSPFRNALYITSSTTAAQTSGETSGPARYDEQQVHSTMIEMIFRIPRLLVLLSIMAILSQAFAQDLDTGLKALREGKYSEALEHIRPLAEQDLAEAQNTLGFMYAQGRGVSQDDEEAVKWYWLAADQGNAVAQYNLGVIYEQGRGVQQDHQEAVKWYRLAAVQGDAIAQFNLGIMYAAGRGVKKDYQEAVKWYRLAAEQGDVVAQHNLGTIYEQGRGVPWDYKEAVKWYRLAANQGDALAQYKLGVIYAQGQGTIRDFVQAYVWFSRASANGLLQATGMRDALGRLMTAAQIEEAQHLIDELRLKTTESQ